MADVFPRGDQEFLAAIGLFFKAVETKQASLADFDAPRITSLETVMSAFKASLENQQQKQAESQSATAQKNLDRKTAEAAFNEAAQDYKDDDAMTDADIAEAGLDLPDDTPTASAAPTTRPIGQVDTSQRLEHRIEFADETSIQTGRKAKPDGVRTCQILEKIGGEPPVDVDECDFVAEDSGSPYLRVHKGADAGKTVYYILRWVSTRGETGPISETIAATITG